MLEPFAAMDGFGELFFTLQIVKARLSTLRRSVDRVDEEREAYVRFMECMDRGASLQDVYSQTEHGFAVRSSVPSVSPAVAARRKKSRRKQFLRIYDHIRNIADPVDRHIGLAGKHALDFGCGTGALAVAVALKGATVTAVDPTPVSLEACRWRASYFGLDETRLITRQVAPAPGLPFADASFDLVTVNSVLEFIPRDRHLYILDLLRLVRPGGHLVVSGENGLYPRDYYTGQLVPGLRKEAMIARNLPYGVSYFELRRWLRSSPRRVEDLSVRNWFNSVDKLAQRQASAGRQIGAAGLSLANGVVKAFCRAAGVPSDILLPYTTFVFRVID